MREVDGAQLLSKVKARSISTIRILPTGQANAEAANRAVNQGGVYRFLMKPCESEDLLAVLADACEQ
ncbi:hypothetical protein [Halioxenophilus sp. WMMB6]|uniref:hypothetical protein n=1 Tax=Halioxenophilus sp. WMMB6 TaxID=3073815 RepID=UPI00295EC181|nr:hypothetical protein [Halioxenophilus sp. WMMB6]